MVRGYPHTIPSTGSNNGRGTDCPRRGNERNSNDTNGTAGASTPGGQRPPSRNPTPRASSDDDRLGGEARSARIVKRKLKQQGVKVSLMAASEITRLANAHLQRNAAELLRAAEASGAVERLMREAPKSAG